MQDLSEMKKRKTEHRLAGEPPEGAHISYRLLRNDA